METNSRILAFIGSYADAAAPGLYACSYDTETGQLELLEQASGLQNPTFLTIDARSHKLYVLSEATDEEGKRCGAAATYEFHSETGQLTHLNTEKTVPATTCHIALDQTSQLAMVSSYHGGMVGVSPILPDGSLGVTSDIQQHEGSSLLPVQDRPRTHSVFVDRANRYVGVCDLGLDQIVMYKLDLESQRLISHGVTKVTPGSGPRHFALHRTLPYGYVINELNSTIIAFAYDEEKGQLTELQTVATLPEDYTGDNATADIHISPDGRFLYGSNRGHDSIVVFEIDSSSGKLSYVEHSSTLGGHPRNFGISPDGKFLLVANRDGNNIVTLARDGATGKLQPTGGELSVSKPVCIRFAE
ncbi:lactonase family protein [Paenibacillus hexagrammi]|uniref:Lactonase family protein n=1 Tax=Paenibacillus hexagrammi TaxID=2908839 RepID=A0ABY3SQR2_9BACL|nr:lactonase family protein [Paenibacillus sp. YPD9-1]UJF35455.1 lactonase family protein [Paenibacillus sp. YPD9-1]